MTPAVTNSRDPPLGGRSQRNEPISQRPRSGHGHVPDSRESVPSPPQTLSTTGFLHARRGRGLQKAREKTARRNGVEAIGRVVRPTYQSRQRRRASFATPSTSSVEATPPAKTTAISEPQPFHPSALPVLQHEQDHCDDRDRADEDSTQQRAAGCRTNRLLSIHIMSARRCFAPHGSPLVRSTCSYPPCGHSERRPDDPALVH
jgi:hypothetical protein